VVTQRGDIWPTIAYLGIPHIASSVPMPLPLSEIPELPPSLASDLANSSCHTSTWASAVSRNAKILIFVFQRAGPAVATPLQPPGHALSLDTTRLGRNANAVCPETSLSPQYRPGARRCSYIIFQRRLTRQALRPPLLDMVMQTAEQSPLARNHCS
jgi:hypothetical protein